MGNLYRVDPIHEGCSKGGQTQPTCALAPLFEWSMGGNGGLLHPMVS